MNKEIETIKMYFSNPPGIDAENYQSTYSIHRNFKMFSEVWVVDSFVPKVS